MSASQPDLSVFRQIAEQTSEVGFVYDLVARHFVYLGPAFEPVWQRSPRSVLEDPASLLDTVHPEDREYVSNNYQHFLKRKEKTRLDFRIRHPDGCQRWIALKTYPIAHEDGVRYACGFAEDDTPRKENLLHMQITSGKKDASLHIVAHDLRGPLGIIGALAGAIEKKLGPSEEPLLQQAKMIREICQRNVNMVRSLLNQEYLQSTKVEVDKERLDLIGEIKAILEQYRQAQENIQKQFTLTANLERVYAEVDSLKFLSVINNLISNAVKFTKDNGQIRLHVEEQPNTILLTVQDDGVGIPKKYHPVLFEQFTKARRPGLKGEDAVGLGMSIVKRLVELHEGKVWFESGENKGTTFFVEIPKKSISTSRL